MKSLLCIFISLVCCFGSLYDCTAQQQDTLYFDPASGNYIIEYRGQFAFIRARDGSLRFYEEDKPQPGEVFVYKDSMVTIIFEPATKINPKVNSVVTKDSQKNTYLYSYSIANGADSQQNLRVFILEFGIDDVTDASTRWSSDRIRGVRNGQIAFINRWMWSGDKGLEPTWSTDGFALESPGLPGIMNANFRGRTPILEWPTEPPGKIETQMFALEVYPANHVLRKTVAPVAPPTSFVPLDFLGTLISYTQQAFDLGWIDDQDIVNDLDEKLGDAKQQLEQGETKEAIEILQDFIEEVEEEAGVEEEDEDEEDDDDDDEEEDDDEDEDEEEEEDDEKHLTSEAYALLKYNAEFLIGKLSEQ